MNTGMKRSVRVQKVKLELSGGDDGRTDTSKSKEDPKRRGSAGKEINC